MTKKIKIEDNFLEQEKFDEIELIINPLKQEYVKEDGSASQNISWYFRYQYYAKPTEDKSFRGWEEEEGELDQFQFTHTFYDGHIPQSPYMEQVNCFFKPLHMVSIFRIRANLLTRLPKIVSHPFHTDITFLSEKELAQWTTSIFYVNTNNGYTLFEDGTKVESNANRMLTIPANIKHTGTTCTDQPIRIVVNFNYYRRTT